MSDYDSFAETPGMFAGRWWTMVLRGIVAILFAVLAFALPEETLHHILGPGSMLRMQRILMLLFGCYALVDGICMLIAAMGPRRHNRWLLALEGIVGMGLGIVVLRAPVASAVVLLYYMSVWAVALGFLRIVEAILLRKEISGEMWLALSGVVAILFAVTLMVLHRMSAVALIWLIAGYALVTGIFEVLLGIELRRPHDIASSHPNGRQRIA
jgi:uncharacterized membrane protein HdeD (DUF308 family)